jgi:lipoprotein-anchoring transpeptidase ErfK/SrfK
VARRAVVAVVVVAALGAVAAVVLLLSRGEPERSEMPPRAVPRVPERAEVKAPHAPFGARLVRRVLLRERPGGRVVRALGTRTGYGSPRVLAVVARRGKWLGVLSQHRSNSRAGWIPVSGALLLHEPYSLDVDLSARTIVVRRDGRLRRRIVVAIGRSLNPTPTGRFAVTDLLVIGRGGAAYGCCALALTARQRNVPQGWTGGDRLAIHGTSNEASLGNAVSSGCLRASDRDMRWLLARVALGALVRVRA